MNPHNAKADIEYTEGTNTTHLFEENVALNVPNGILGIGIFCLCVMRRSWCKDKPAAYWQESLSRGEAAGRRSQLPNGRSLALSRGEAAGKRSQLPIGRSLALSRGEAAGKRSQLPICRSLSQEEKLLEREASCQLAGVSLKRRSCWKEK